MNFVDIRSDLGGARIGLECLGYNCIASLTWENFLSRNHSDCIGHEAGVLKNIGSCDLLSMQAPALDTVNGYWGSDGTWISMRDVSDMFRRVEKILHPRTVIVVGRKCILSERNGTSFADLLIAFSELGYECIWTTLNLSSIGVPQDAIRIGIIAHRSPERHKTSCRGSIANQLLSNLSELEVAELNLNPRASLEALVEKRRPRIGLRKPAKPNPFSTSGIAWGDNFRSGNLPRLKDMGTENSLPTVLGLADRGENIAIKSVRFVSRNGVKGLQFKRNGLAHSIGPSISAWPLFAISDTEARNIQIPPSYYNWTGSIDGHFVFRVSPARALFLFGSQAHDLVDVLEEKPRSISNQYKTIAATTAPPLVAYLSQAFISPHRENSGEKDRRL